MLEYETWRQVGRPLESEPSCEKTSACAGSRDVCSQSRVPWRLHRKAAPRLAPGSLSASPHHHVLAALFDQMNNILDNPLTLCVAEIGIDGQRNTS